MKKTKTQKGITLIALIITIIVLLILAVVAIGAVQNDGIIQYAKNARNDYELAQGKENTALDNYLAKLDENNPGGSGSGDEGNDTETPVSLTGPWTQNGTVLTNANGDTINVGDTVNYVSNAGISIVDRELGGSIRKKYETDLGGSWKVLGVDNGNLLLMGTKKVGLYDEWGLQGNDVSIFGSGEYASTARYIKVDDINKITGYNPEIAKYGEGTISEYGNKVTYVLEENYIEAAGVTEYTIKFTVEGKENLNGETDLGELWYDVPSEGTFISSYYSYNPQNDMDNKIYSMIFDETYVLDNLFNKTTANGNYTGVFCVLEGQINGRYISEAVPDVEQYFSDYGYRPVVTLESNVMLTGNGQNSWTLSKPSAE